MRPDLCSHPYGNYLIFFHYVGDVFEVVRDIEAFYGDDER